jgi:hypothetical protein
MSAENALGLAVAVLVLLYLAVTIFFPERF